MAGVHMKFWKALSNLSNPKNVLTAKITLAPHQCFASVKQSMNERANIPEKPKRPPTSFLTFFNSNFKKLSNQNPGASHKEIVKLAGKEWRECDPQIRSSYQEKFKKDWASYLEAKENYELKLTPAMKAELLAEQEKAKEVSLKKKLKQIKKELGKPSKPPTPWAVFLKSKVAEKGDTPFKEWVQNVAKEWNSLDDKIKEKKELEYQSALSKFHAALNKWEEEMIRNGRTELVRVKSQIKQSKK